MATKTYRIEINGVSQAISEFDELIAKAGQLERTLSSGVSVEIKGDTTQLAQAQAEVTKQVERQNEALREQTSIIQSQAGDYKEALTVATSILGTYEENIKKLAEYDAELKKIAAAKKEAERAGASTDEMAMLLQMEMKYKALKSDTLGVIRTETKLIEAENGSYDQMAATVSRLRDALRASSGNLSSGEFSTISAAVDDLDRKLKDADKGMGQFFRNVGNYPSAAEGFSKIKVEVEARHNGTEERHGAVGRAGQDRHRRLPGARLADARPSVGDGHRERRDGEKQGRLVGNARHD